LAWPDRRGPDVGQARRDRGHGVFEWAADPEADPTDPATWRSAMPAMNYTISEETVAKDLASMSLAQFKRSHVNVWPD
jgi:hypothetical protein